MLWQYGLVFLATFLLPEESNYSSALFYQTGVCNPSVSSGGISYAWSELTKDQWLLEDASTSSVHEPKRYGSTKCSANVS